MKTDDLIRALAADREPAGPAPGQALALAGAAGFVLSMLLFSWLVPLRPNLGEAIQSFPFVLKPIEMGILVVAAAIVVLRLAKPGAPLGHVLLVAAAVPAIMVSAVAVELTQVPRAEWLVKLAGVHWYMCVLNMVLLSLPILAALLFGLRYGAPTRPMLAGAGAGLLSGALAASLYIAHCPDDSPLFVAAWFTLAIAIATGIGAMAGSRVLRW
ncbi:MAG: NrsF family protein [Pseudorhodoplanes sp.]|uniref:NrsF family protein n=1 Tax=Pseudorhodoplanes sp. TaxID=1934341 RepID=UPI003D117545